MRRFHFKLQKLLELKEYREREWEQKLGELTGRMEAIRQRIAECGRNRRQAFISGASAGNDFVARVAAENYIRRMEHTSSQLHQDLGRLGKEREKIQVGYIEASRERKVFEKLKEKKAAEFYREERKNEILKQDDLNSSAAARRIEAGGKE
ncbi:flagellar export protein FliJ [Marispirochaeta aestuarii]|uniref:flagellar export protein FliJ n=1 Tax=Marispirochaeta aestuarii TaxID=1963862 RepID=UPI002ABE88E0|nr:flagellar export protein FliJ [Marispirochaeta aestuarii]